MTADLQSVSYVWEYLLSVACHLLWCITPYMKGITLATVTAAHPFVKQKNMISLCIVHLLAAQDDDTATPSPRRASLAPLLPTISTVVLHL